MADRESSRGEIVKRDTFERQCFSILRTGFGLDRFFESKVLIELRAIARCSRALN